MEKDMSEHYYTVNPTSKDNIHLINYSFGEISLKLSSNSGVFSVSHVDFGSNLLITTAAESRTWNNVKVLDIGCGYGVIGISLAKIGADVTMCDVNERARQLAELNSAANDVKTRCIISDAASDIDDVFDVVVSNPPIRAGKDTVYKIFDNAKRVLTVNGELYVVIRKQQGAESAMRYISDLFGECQMINRKSGYWIIRAAKR